MVLYFHVGHDHVLRDVEEGYSEDGDVYCVDMCYCWYYSCRGWTQEEGDGGEEGEEDSFCDGKVGRFSLDIP